MLEVNEIFGPTIQGEGKKVGTPSVFVRFGKCNMQCSGFEVAYETPSGIKKFSCDSYYASDIAFRDCWDKYESSKPLIEKINSFLPNYKVNIVITGGEPLLYWDDEEFQKLLYYYISNDYSITIETNGSIPIRFNHLWQKKILFSISVKLSNSKEPLKKRVNKKALTNIINYTKESYLKFVLDKDFLSTASKEIKDIISNIPKCDIYIMPLGDTIDILNQNSEDIIQFALNNNFKYSDRLHIRLWNNKRGV